MLLTHGMKQLFWKCHLEDSVRVTDLQSSPSSLAGNEEDEQTAKRLNEILLSRTVGLWKTLSSLAVNSFRFCCFQVQRGHDWLKSKFKRAERQRRQQQQVQFPSAVLCGTRARQQKQTFRCWSSQGELTTSVHPIGLFLCPTAHRSANINYAKTSSSMLSLLGEETSELHFAR